MVDQDARYVDLGATCADGDDGSMIPNITNNASAIVTSMVGNQTVMYTCTDLQGNVNTAGQDRNGRGCNRTDDHTKWL